MKITKGLLIFAVLCTFSFINTNVQVKARNEKINVYEINADSFKEIDYLNGASELYSMELLNGNLKNEASFYTNKILYEKFYLKIYARTSVRLAIVDGDYYPGEKKISWDGATDYNPQIDIVYEDVKTGKQFSVLDDYGEMPISKNAGETFFSVAPGIQTRVWLRSLNYMDITFYRVSIIDFS